jgi:predicted nucleic acid-binding protein
VIFVDTSFWAALLWRRDTNHEDARKLLGAYGDEPMITSNHVRGEAWTVLRRRDGHHTALRFLDLLETSPRIEVARASEDVEREALAWLRRHDERRYSFVDASAFVFMRQRRITTALAFDGDFSAAGFIELRP